MKKLYVYVATGLVLLGTGFVVRTITTQQHVIKVQSIKIETTETKTKRLQEEFVRLKADFAATDKTNTAEIERLKQKEKELNDKATRLEAELQAKRNRPATIASAVVPAAQAAPSAPTGSVWDSLAQCESGSRWDYNGGSGFDGGIQFLPSTWNAMKTGYAYAWQAPRDVQIDAGMRLQARSGWGQWPACARKLGLL